MSQISTIEAADSLFWRKDRKESQHTFQGEILIPESIRNDESGKGTKRQNQEKMRELRILAILNPLWLFQPT